MLTKGVSFDTPSQPRNCSVRWATSFRTRGSITAYAWVQHLRIARDAGFTDDDIERIQLGGDASGLDPFEAALLRSVDELLDQHCVQDATWATLGGRYDKQALVELLMVAAHFFSLALTLNSVGVQPEP